MNGIFTRGARIFSVCYGSRLSGLKPGITEKKTRNAYRLADASFVRELGYRYARRLRRNRKPRINPEAANHLGQSRERTEAPPASRESFAASARKGFSPIGRSQNWRLCFSRSAAPGELPDGKPAPLPQPGSLESEPESGRELAEPHSQSSRKPHRRQKTPAPEHEPRPPAKPAGTTRTSPGQVAS